MSILLPSRLLRSLLPLFAFIVAAATLHAQEFARRILVRPRANAAQASLDALYRSTGLYGVDSVVIGPMHVVVLVPEHSEFPQTSTLESLSTSGLFEWAAADTIVAEVPFEPSRPVPPTHTAAARTLLASSPANLPNDPLFAQQWALYNPGTVTGSIAGSDINLLDAWHITRGDGGVVVAVGEEGIEADHPDLAGQFIGDSAEIEEINNGNQHGTRVCGIIGARAGNGIGIAGIAPDCRMIVVNSRYGTTLLGVLKALEKVVEHDAAVFTNSWGFSQPARQPLQEAFDIVARTNREGRGCLVIFAAGNDFKPWVHYPSWHSRFLSVGGTSSADARFVPGGFGNELDLCAPAQGVISTEINGGYSISDGTSIAAPTVAGVAALVFAVNPELTADSVRAILERTCDKVGGYRYDQIREHGSWSPYTGYGRVNAGRAVRMALGIPDTAARIVWPRGNERFVPDEEVQILWHGDSGTRLFLRDTAGVERALAVLPDSGAAVTTWRPGSAGRFTLLLRTPSKTILDSTGLPIRVAQPQWMMGVDTAAPFVSVNDSALRRRLRLLVPCPSIYALPFDLPLGRDTAWTWENAAWGGSLPGGPTLQLPRRLILDPNAETTPAVVDLYSNFTLGVDSAWYAVAGESPEREVIVELVGLRADTSLTTAEERKRLRTMRRQIRYREIDGSIQLNNSQEIALAPVPDNAHQQPAAAVALRLRDELYLPFGPIPQHIPAGSVTFTPRAYHPISTPHHAVVRSGGSRNTYGYDVYRVNVIANTLDTIDVLGSTDGGTLWKTMARIAPGRQESRVLVPPFYSGELLLKLTDGAGSPWRDTLRVVDPGYSIETMPRNATSLRDDPLAKSFTVSRSVDGVVLELPFTFPYGGRTFTHGFIRPRGTIELMQADGSSNIYAMLSCYPRVGATDGDSIVPVRYRTVGGGVEQRLIVEWDSLSRFSPAGARQASAQLILHADGVVEAHLLADSGRGAYASYPSITSNEFYLAPPDFTLRINQLDSLTLPLSSYRFLPHTPIAAVATRQAQPHKIVVTPHPASVNAHISTLDGSALRCRVLDPAGRLLHTFDTPGGTASLPPLPPGVYLLLDDLDHTAQQFMVVQ